MKNPTLLCYYNQPRREAKQEPFNQNYKVRWNSWKLYNGKIQVKQIKKLKLGCYCQISPAGKGPGHTKEKRGRGKVNKVETETSGGRARGIKAGSKIQRQALLGGQFLLRLASKVPHSIGATNLYLQSCGHIPSTDPNLKEWGQELKLPSCWVAANLVFVSSYQGQIYFGNVFPNSCP